MGFPDLNARDKQRAVEADVLVIRSYDIATNCILQNVPFAMENPFMSLMWQTNDLKHLARLANVMTTRYDFGQYGEPYNKKTKMEILP